MFADNDEEDPPMPPSQIALQYKEMDVAKETDDSDGGIIPLTTMVSGSKEQKVAAALAERVDTPMGNHLGADRVMDEVAPGALSIGNNNCATNDDAAAADNQINIQPHIVNNEEPTGDGGSNEIQVPDAYLVVDEEDRSNSPPPQPPADPIIIDGYAEPLLPWWKQTRTRALLAVVCLVLIVAAVAIISSFSRNNKAPADVTTVLVVVDTTPPPSTSFAPTPQLTYTPTEAPSSCALTLIFKAWYNAGYWLDLPLNEPLSPKMRLEGRNAVFVVREANTRSIYVVFFYFDGWKWVRTDIFIESYEELKEEEQIYDYSLALSGSTALVGFSRKDTETGGVGAGLVYVFEQRDGDGGPSWTKVGEPLLPDDGGGHGAGFGYSTDLQGDLAVVGALREGALYIYQKTSDGGSGGGSWRQRLKFDVDYDMTRFQLKDDIIVTYDRFYAEIHTYRYNRGLNRIVPLQDAIVVDSTRREYPIFSEQVEATGTSTSFVKMRASKDHIVYTTMTYNNDSKWTLTRATVYKREGAGNGNNQKFTFLQDFNASDYHDTFGWDLTIDQDVLVIGGGGQNVVFALKENGYFEEEFQFNSWLYSIQVSGRNAIAIDYDYGVFSLNFADCLQKMPTQSPSSSISVPPSSTPSALNKSSSISPTSLPPTSTHIPSSSPTSSLGPSISVAPTYLPTMSSNPTSCYDIRIVITTVGANMKGFENNATSWELYRKRSREVILQGDQLQDDAKDEYEAECIEQDDYVFKITSSGGYGFGECSNCGYYLYVDERYIGGNTDFVGVDTVNFRLPLYQRELNDDVLLFNEPPACVGDFFLTIDTGDKPELITWDVIDEDGETLVEGGPYSKALGGYREFACLPDGNFTFTINNGEDGGYPLTLPHVVYYFGVEWDTIVFQSSLLGFNTSESTSFVLGT